MAVAAAKTLLHHRGSLHTDFCRSLPDSDAPECRSCGLHAKRTRLAEEGNHCGQRLHYGRQSLRGTHQQISLAIRRYGFAHKQEGYENGENPFRMGTYQITEATQSRKTTSDVVWMPEILVEDDYAVYVSYQTLPNSIPDANYTVYHGGIATHFRVNQQMGGGTWVYLGTFHFTKGKSEDNCVILSNLSSHKGVVTADAVRFGGGMGNIVRGDSTMALPISSDLPRCLDIMFLISAILE